MQGFGKSVRKAALGGAAALLGAVVAGQALAEDKFVALTYIVDHPAINAAIEGVADALADAGYVKGENLKWEIQSAQGNMATQAQIATKFVGDRPDAIVAVSTPSAQAVLSNTQDIPIIFVAVTDPVGAKLVESLDEPGGNVTGVSDMSPVAEDMKLIKEVTPDVEQLGVIYNPGEANSVTLVELVKEHAPKHGMEVVEAGAPNTGAVLQGARALVGKGVDAIYVPADSTVTAGFEAITKVAQDSETPLYAADTSTVKRGAMVAQGFDYYDIGRIGGEMLVRVLEGADPATMPVRFSKKFNLHVNPSAAENYGVELPESVLNRADEVIE